MKSITYMMSLSVVAIILTGCGDAGKLSEREGTSTPTSNSTTTSTIPTTTPISVEEEINYKIEKVQNLTSSQQEILEIHNENRVNEFGDSPLVYSLELEKVAKDYAEKLAKTGKQAHDPENIKNGYGENLLAHAYKRDISIGFAMEQWYNNEKKYYDYETGDCNTTSTIEGNDANTTCGHYTQVVWQETKEVGCALAPYTVDSNESNYSEGSVLICRYTKAGNVKDEKPYCTNYVTNDIYTGTIPSINTKDITGKDMELELTQEDRVKCERTDNRNGKIHFARGFQVAQLIDFDIFNGDKYTTTLQFDDIEIEQNIVKMKGIGHPTKEDSRPIFMNIEFVGETDTYYGVKLEWNGYDAGDAKYSRTMKAKIFK